MAVELEDIEAELSEILLPQPKRSLPQLNMVRDIAVSGEKVKLTLALSILSATERERVQESVRAAIEALPGVKELAREAEAPLLGQLPVDPDLAALCDRGEIERYNTEPFTSLSAAFIQAVPALSRTA